MADYPNKCGAGEDMKVDGKTGIGVSSPSEKLHVYQSGDTKAVVESSNNHAGVRIMNNNCTWLWQSLSGGTFRRYEEVGGSTGERITVSSGGNMGIGVSGAAQKLEVNGAIKIGGASGSPADGTIWFDGSDLKVKLPSGIKTILVT